MCNAFSVAARNTTLADPGCAPSSDPYSCCLIPTGSQFALGDSLRKSPQSKLSDSIFCNLYAVGSVMDDVQKTRIAPLRIDDPDCSTIEPRASSEAMRFGS
jgi:hypothetical protein